MNFHEFWLKQIDHIDQVPNDFNRKLVPRHIGTPGYYNMDNIGGFRSPGFLRHLVDTKSSLELSLRVQPPYEEFKTPYIQGLSIKHEEGRISFPTYLNGIKYVDNYTFTMPGDQKINLRDIALRYTQGFERAGTELMFFELNTSENPDNRDRSSFFIPLSKDDGTIYHAIFSRPSETTYDIVSLFHEVAHHIAHIRSSFHNDISQNPRFSDLDDEGFLYVTDNYTQERHYLDWLRNIRDKGGTPGRNINDVLEEMYDVMWSDELIQQNTDFEMKTELDTWMITYQMLKDTGIFDCIFDTDEQFLKNVSEALRTRLPHKFRADEILNL